MVKVCLSIGYYKAFLKDAVTKSGTREEFPKNKGGGTTKCYDRHFVDNEALVEVLQPLGDLIGELEEFNTSLADIIRRHAQRADRNPFIEDSPTLLSKRYKQYFTNEIFLIALFLTPKYRDFAVYSEYAVIS